jgi:hypothetical protein
MTVYDALTAALTQTSQKPTICPCLLPALPLSLPPPPQATILLPCTDNFVMHSVRDRIQEPIIRHPLVKRMALLISLLWAVALTIMTAGAAIPVTLARNPQLTPMRGIKIVVPVLSFGPLLLAVPLQLIIAHIYRKKIAQHYQQQQQQQAAAVAAGDVRHESDQQGARKGDDAV